MRLAFCKMHGAGNDFVVIDRRGASTALDPGLISLICDRHRGIGCDQLLTVEAPRSPRAVLAFSIWNADGSRAGQCGNGARCIAAWARRVGLAGADPVLIDSPAGPLQAQFLGQDIDISLGEPRFDPAALPFVADSRGLQVDHGGRGWPIALVSMGNPHALIEVSDLASAPVAALGAQLQADRRFPDSCNVGFWQRLAADRIGLRVFERGVGETLACGSGACAAAVLAMRAEQVSSPCQVELPGGRLTVAWDGPGTAVRLAGPATFVFAGELEHD